MTRNIQLIFILPFMLLACKNEPANMNDTNRAAAAAVRPEDPATPKRASQDELDFARNQVRVLLAPISASREAEIARIAQLNDSLLADNRFARFLTRYISSVDTISETLYGDQRFQTIASSIWGASPADTVESWYAPFGLNSGFSDEGSPTAGVDYRYLKSRFGPHLSSTMNRYLDLRAFEVDDIWCGDGSIAISWDELADRLLMWERFLQAYPQFPLRVDVERRYRAYLRGYLNGLSNAPVFADPPDGGLSAEVRESYSRFVRANPHSGTARTVREYLTILARHNYRNSRESASFLERNFLFENDSLQFF